jgi:hypothetical protein
MGGPGFKHDVSVAVDPAAAGLARLLDAATEPLQKPRSGTVSTGGIVHPKLEMM